ncbi:LysR family transcriptional regulator [Pengzhenrongella frigida]|uniref:LysR family transcriptional regulator n=1 Tax=Pengzhenrongella frigida TaxID=1259133 RepID=A0A4Q5MZ60_9MICO|nr:LysR family transcriptional regulator [Cellulomonas sp. HLT2-17]
MDVDLVRLRYLAAVADHLHFGRAAAALHVARPTVSRALLELEAELGVELFVRPSERTELTPAGVELLEQARLRIAQDDLAQAAPRSDDDAPEPFTIGIMPGVTVSKWTRLWADRKPDAPLKVVRTDVENQVSALHAGIVDVSFVRLPIAQAGLSTIALYAELPVVVVPKDHPATLLDMVTVADLVDEHLLQDPNTVPEWRDAAATGRTVERRPLPAMRTMADAVALVAAGIGVVIVPQSVARMNHRKDVTYLPVVDVAESHVALAWLADRTTPEIEEFIGIVRGRSAQSSRATPTPARDAGARSAEPAAGRSRASGGGGGAKRPAPSARKPAKAAPKSRRGRR